MARIWLTIVFVIVLAGCSTLGFRSEGHSGSVAWRAADLRVVQRKAEGEDRNLYAFTLVLTETQGKAIAFNQVDYTISQPGINELGTPQQENILWKLPPHGELRRPFFSYWYCDQFDCQYADFNPAPWWEIILTGTDDQDRPVRVAIDLRLPPNPLRPNIAKSSESPSPTHAPTPEAPHAQRYVVPIQTSGNTPMVNAVLNEREYVTLMVDTGTTNTMITPEAAKRLRIKLLEGSPTLTSRVIGGQEVKFSPARLQSVAVGEVVVNDLLIGVATVLPEAPLIDGVLGMDFLCRFSTTLNYANSRLLLDTPVSTATSPVASTPIQIVDNKIQVETLLNHDATVTLLLDTGSTYTMLHPEVMARVGIAPATAAPKKHLNVFGGRKMTFPVVAIDAVAVGDAVVENLQAGVFHAIPYDHNLDGILGGDFLQQFDVTLNCKTNRLQLVSRGAPPSPPQR